MFEWSMNPMLRELAPDFKSSFSGSTLFQNWSFLCVKPDTITWFELFESDVAISRMFDAIDSRVSDFRRSLVPQCRIMTSGFWSLVGIIWLRIHFVVAPEKDLTTTFFSSFDKFQPWTSFIIESPKIANLVWFIRFLRL